MVLSVATNLGLKSVAAPTNWGVWGTGIRRVWERYRRGGVGNMHAIAPTTKGEHIKVGASNNKPVTHHAATLNQNTRLSAAVLIPA